MRKRTWTLRHFLILHARSAAGAVQHVQVAAHVQKAEGRKCANEHCGLGCGVLRFRFRNYLELCIAVYRNVKGGPMFKVKLAGLFRTV